MARQIDIKGIRDGLLIRVNDGPDFAVYERLRRELEQKRDFLQGGRVTVELGRRPLNREQLAGLQELFVAHDLELWAVIADDGDIDLLNVYDIAQKPALQVSQHLEVRYLARLMIQYSVKSVLVIDNNDLQGFVSDTDVVGSLIDRAAQEG